MSPFSIHRIQVQEVEALQAVARQTFSETFAENNDPVNMQKYLDQSFSIHQLQSEIKTSGSEFYFAQLEDENIGYLKINFGAAQTEIQYEQAMEIERIYVLEAFHRQNWGQKLFDKALERALQNQIHFLWLGVWQENTRAVNFYKKNGFIQFDQHIFQLGDEAQTDVMMKLELPRKA